MPQLHGRQPSSSKIIDLQRFKDAFRNASVQVDEVQIIRKKWKVLRRGCTSWRGAEKTHRSLHASFGERPGRSRHQGVGSFGVTPLRRVNSGEISVREGRGWRSS